MRIDRATIEDAAEILALQKLAYRSEAALYDDYTIPPLIQSIGENEADFADQVFFKTTLSGERIIGSVSG